MRRWVWPWGLLILLGLTACGGSGSSGFDGPHTDTLSASRLAENALIAEVIDNGVCMQVDTLNVCPTNTRITSTGAEVDTPLSPMPPSISCSQRPSNPACTVAVTFTPQGFARTQRFFVAARPLLSNAPWQRGNTTVVTGPVSASRLDAVLEVPAPAAQQTTADILVVLLVVADPLVTVPAQFDQLEDSGADFAIVTQLAGAN